MLGARELNLTILIHKSSMSQTQLSDIIYTDTTHKMKKKNQHSQGSHYRLCKG